MFPQSIMIATRGHDLDTCPHWAFAKRPLEIRCQPEIEVNRIAGCSMALAYAAPQRQKTAF